MRVAAATPFDGALPVLLASGASRRQRRPPERVHTLTGGEGGVDEIGGAEAEGELGLQGFGEAAHHRHVRVELHLQWPREVSRERT